MKTSGKIDVLYILRFQVERWTDEELESHSDLRVAREELKKRRDGLGWEVE